MARIEASARPQLSGSARAAHRARVDVAIIRTMRDTLARVGEAAAMRWDQIAPATGGTGTLVFRRGKTDTETTSWHTRGRRSGRRIAGP